MKCKRNIDKERKLWYNSKQVRGRNNLKISHDFNKLKKLINERGYLNSENEINTYYENNKNDAAILYKARLEYLKRNFKDAIKLIEEEYIPTFNMDNNIIYFLALCHLELNEYTEVYKILRLYNFNISNKKNEEIIALKIFIEKRLDNFNFKEYKNSNSYLINQTINYSTKNAVKYNYSHNDFIIEEEILNSIVRTLNATLDNVHKEVSLDIFDKYYFYYPNIGKINDNIRNAFIVKTLRNSKEIIYIEPTTVKTKAYINDYRHLGNNSLAPFVLEDLERQVSENGLFESEKLINWLYFKYPFSKMVLTYKIQLECALGEYKEALDIIYNDYIPMFGNDPKIFFFIVNLLCNTKRYEEAYNLLNTKKIDNFVDNVSIKKYRYLKLYLEKQLGLFNEEVEPTDYIEKQIKDYDCLRAIEYIMNKNMNSEYQLNLTNDLSEDELFDFMVMLDDELKIKLKTYQDDFCDSYYFRKEAIGIKDEEYTDVFGVYTIKNTFDIIDIFPVESKNCYRINELGNTRKRVKNKIYLKNKTINKLENK